MKTYKKVLKIVLNVFIWVFVVFSIFMTILAFAAQSNPDGVPSLGGTCFLSVASPSMSPTFEQGDLIFGEMLTSDQKKSGLAVDDVITFRADLDGNGTVELNTHRIVEINYDENNNVLNYVTKGDNNPISDTNPVDPNFVVSRWNGKRVANVGGFLSFLQTPKGFLIVIVLPLVFFFLCELVVFIKTLVGIKNEKNENNKISKEEEDLIRQQAIEDYKRQLMTEANAPTSVPSSDKKPETPADESPKENSDAENADVADTEDKDKE